ncbi:MAG: 30S ribosomal protein S18 [Bifidobacteriaceae bacterium]|jgi:small subunit ribosomal protein S18|nr:30S ribosomal protein S18 [Bifidobacteriaceae bacterium]
MAAYNTSKKRWKNRYDEQIEKINILKEFGVTTITYKDVAILQKFVTDKGKIRSREMTGVSAQQQRQIARAIKNARELALMPFVPKKPRTGAEND